MTTQFKTGQVYSCRSVCDYDCIFSFEVVSRTEKTVSLKAYGKTTRRTVSLYDGVEQCHPHGKYSMSPVLTAKSN
jgi:hypothetical protein